MNIICARDVKKSFGSFQALQGINLQVRTGECVGLLGPNGAGKSTFINLIYGASLRTSGSLEVFGLDPTISSSRIKRKLGVVPQENALDDALTVVENMRLFARFVGLGKRDAAARIDELLAYMSLDHKKDSLIKSLSGGMKRRLAFVRALLADPELLILDEPTTGLDPAVRHLLWQRVSDLRRRGKTIVITTHYMHEAEVLCDRIIILNQGKVIDENTPSALIQKHTPGFVATFHGDEEFSQKLRARLPSDWSLYRQQDSWCVRAPVLNALVEFQKLSSFVPLQIRPANLEDVYLRLTGEELSQND